MFVEIQVNRSSGTKCELQQLDVLLSTDIWFVNVTIYCLLITTVKIESTILILQGCDDHLFPNEQL